MLPRTAPLTDSPLFWLMLFGSVGLVMLAAVEPKFARRQERIERMQESRKRSRPSTSPPDNQSREYDPSTTPIWQPGRPVSLRPLMLFVAGILVAGMIVMYVRRAIQMSERRPSATADAKANSG